jgi:hypothetical protein
VASLVTAALLLLAGTGTALRMRRRPNLTMASALSAPAATAGGGRVPAAGDSPETEQAFDRLPDHIQKDLLEIGDILEGMGRE